MKVLLTIFMLLVLSGCATTPVSYDLNTNRLHPPLKANDNVLNMEIIDFTYEPHINLSQHATSNFGCLPCRSDGSHSGIIFEQPIARIIEQEVLTAVNEVMLPGGSQVCSLMGNVHLVGWNSMNTDSTVDLTFYLKKNNEPIYKKRIRGKHSPGVFSMVRTDRIYAMASRHAVEQLLVDQNFRSLLLNHCSK